MSNVFDQFDNQSQNPFNQFDEPEPQQRGMGGELLRQAGLTGRHIAQGVGNIFTGPTDAINSAIDGVLAKAGIEHRQGSATQAVTTGLDKLGLPEPETPTERVVGTASEFLAGGGGFVKAGQSLANRAANQTAARVGETLASNPMLQGVSNVSGGLAAGAVQEGGGSAGQQVAAGVLGSVLPGAAPSLGSAALRGAVRGRDGQQMQGVIDDFARSGTTPSLGQASGSRTAQAAESIAAKAPGGAGVMAKRAQQSADDIGAAIQLRADQIAPKATATKAGAAIEKGIAGKGGFVDRLMGKASVLYDNVDQHINTSAPIPMSKTQALLDTPGVMAKSAPNTSKVLSSQFLKQIGVSLEDDLAIALDTTGIEGLPYAAVKAMRSQVGERLQNMSLVVDASKADIGKLYGALSDDLTSAANAAGPEAAKAAARANKFYRAGRSRIDELERVVKKAGGTEKIYSAAMSGTKEGATTLRTVMKSLNPDERDVVVAANVRRMGLATPGQQTSSADAFSINTYLTNWARLSPEARSVLFSQNGPEFAKDMGALADVASNIRSGSKVFSNPSGTQQAISSNVTAGTAAYALMTGNLPVFASVAGGVAFANATARAMTNPKYVNWLAKATKNPAGSAIAQANALAQIAAETKDNDLALIAAALEQAGQGQGN